MEYPNGTYTARNDDQAIRDAAVSGQRKEWRAWLKHAFGWGHWLSGYSILLCLLLSIWVQGASSLLMLLASAGFSYFVCLIWVLWYLDNASRSPTVENREEWQCEVSDEGWGFESKGGVRPFIPWSVMSLEFEHDKVWQLSYEGSEVWVYREPLRAAGLEEGFKARIGAPKQR